jgi:hypothetical protein
MTGDAEAGVPTPYARCAGTGIEPDAAGLSTPGRLSGSTSAAKLTASTASTGSLTATTGTTGKLTGGTR